MITIEHLTVQFGGVKALNDVSLALSAAVVGVIGPNGAGKTTLLNALSGFVTPAPASRITADGVDLLAMAPAARARWGLRRSFQAEQVVLELSVAENVQVTLDSSGLSRRESGEALQRALRFVGLHDQTRRTGASLTTGVLIRLLPWLDQRLIHHRRKFLADIGRVGELIDHQHDCEARLRVYAIHRPVSAAPPVRAHTVHTVGPVPVGGLEAEAEA